MVRPKSRKRRERNDRKRWLDEFEDLRRGFENVGKEKRKEEDKPEEEE